MSHAMVQPAVTLQKVLCFSYDMYWGLPTILWHFKLLIFNVSPEGTNFSQINAIWCWKCISAPSHGRNHINIGHWTQSSHSKNITLDTAHCDKHLTYTTFQRHIKLSKCCIDQTFITQHPTHHSYNGLVNVTNLVIISIFLSRQAHMWRTGQVT